MSAEKKKAIARLGGQAAHAQGVAHEFSADEARRAGRKGGERVSADRQHMSNIGRIGGTRTAQKRRPDKGSDQARPGCDAADGAAHASANVGGNRADPPVAARRGKDANRTQAATAEDQTLERDDEEKVVNPPRPAPSTLDEGVRAAIPSPP